MSFMRVLSEGSLRGFRAAFLRYFFFGQREVTGRQPTDVMRRASCARPFCLLCFSLKEPHEIPPPPSLPLDRNRSSVRGRELGLVLCAHASSANRQEMPPAAPLCCAARQYPGSPSQHDNRCRTPARSHGRTASSGPARLLRSGLPG